MESSGGFVFIKMVTELFPYKIPVLYLTVDNYQLLKENRLHAAGKVAHNVT